MVDKAQVLEPLVRHFNESVRSLLQDGLLANYVEQEENLRVLRGRVAFSKHKVGSARRLRRTSAAVPHAGGRSRGRPPGGILGGILAQSSVWSGGSFCRMLPAALGQLNGDATMDVGCVLQEGAFETRQTARGGQEVRLSTPGEALIFFMIRLMERLRECGSAPAVDLMEYGRGLESFGPRMNGGRTLIKGFPQRRQGREGNGGQ